MTSPITEPLLAPSGAKLKLDKVRFPVIASPKLDGIRLLKVGGKIRTRNWKDLPNNYVRTWLEKHLPEGFDGEALTLDEEGRFKPFNSVQSELMSEAGEPDFTFCAFDWVSPNMPLTREFEERVGALGARIFDMKGEQARRIQYVQQLVVTCLEELLAYEQNCFEEGFEGVMIRKPDGPYKCGRSTEREGILLKLKRVEDREDRITGFTEKMTNNNKLEENAFGRAKRSSHKANLAPAGTLGNFLVLHEPTGKTLGVSPGVLTDAERKAIWDNRSKYLGRLITYTFQPFGVKSSGEGVRDGLPRFPRFKGFRHEADT